MVDLSVILPAYDEQEVIAASVRRLAAYLEEAGPATGLWRTWQVLIVDDGSRDETASRATEAAAADDRILVHRLERNLGKGAAVRAGIGEANGEIIVVTDVDLSYALEDVATVVARLRGESGSDERPPGLVTGDRRHPGSRMNLGLSALGHVVRRQALSAAFNLCARLFYGLPDRDTQCGLKGFRRDVARLIASRSRTSGFLADIEMFLIARQSGIRVGNVPVHLTCLSGDSTVHVLRQAPAVFRDALRIRWLQAAGRYRRGP